MRRITETQAAAEKRLAHAKAHADRLALIAKPFPPIRVSNTLSHTYRWAGVHMEKPWGWQGGVTEA